jgi:hypothetical protein
MSGGNMLWGDCDCAGCGESYTSANLSGVLKRLFQILPFSSGLQLNDACVISWTLPQGRNQILRKLCRLAIPELEEQAAHCISTLTGSFQKRSFGERINTQSEILSSAAHVTISGNALQSRGAIRNRCLNRLRPSPSLF